MSSSSLSSSSSSSATATCPNVVIVDVDDDDEEDNAEALVGVTTTTSTSTPLIETLAQILPRGGRGSGRGGGRGKGSGSGSSSSEDNQPSSPSPSPSLVYDWMQGNDPSRYAFSVVLTWIIVSSVMLLWIVLLIVVPKLRVRRHRRRRRDRSRKNQEQGTNSGQNDNKIVAASGSGPHDMTNDPEHDVERRAVEDAEGHNAITTAAAATAGGNFIIPDSAEEEEGHQKSSHPPQKLQIDCGDDDGVGVGNNQSLEEEEQQQQHNNKKNNVESPSHASSVRWWREKRNSNKNRSTTSSSTTRSGRRMDQRRLYSKMSDDDYSGDYGNQISPLPPSSSSSSTKTTSPNSNVNNVSEEGSPSNIIQVYQQQQHDDDDVENTTTAGLYFPSPPPPLNVRRLLAVNSTTSSLHAFVTSPSPVAVPSGSGTSSEQAASTPGDTGVGDDGKHGNDVAPPPPPPPASPSPPSLGSISIDEQSSRYLSYCLSSEKKQRSRRGDNNNNNNNNNTSLDNNSSNSSSRSSVESSFNLLSDDEYESRYGEEDGDDDKENNSVVLLSCDENEKCPTQAATAPPLVSPHNNIISSSVNVPPNNNNNQSSSSSVTSSPSTTTTTRSPISTLVLDDSTATAIATTADSESKFVPQVNGNKKNKHGDSLLQPQLDDDDDDEADDVIKDDEQQGTADAHILDKVVPNEPLLPSQPSLVNDTTATTNNNDLSLEQLLATSKTNNRSTSFNNNNVNNMSMNVDSSFPRTFHEEGLFLFVHHDNDDDNNNNNDVKGDNIHKSHHHHPDKNGDYFISIRSPSKKKPSSSAVSTTEQPATTSDPTTNSCIEDNTSQIPAENVESTQPTDAAAAAAAAVEAPKKDVHFRTEQEPSSSTETDSSTNIDSETHQYQHKSLRHSNFTSDAAAKKREIEQFLSSFRRSSNSIAAPTTTTTAATAMAAATAEIPAEAVSTQRPLPSHDNVESSQPISPLTEMSNEFEGNSKSNNVLLQGKNIPVPNEINTNPTSSLTATPEIPLESPASQWINQWLARVFVSPRNEQDDDGQGHQQTGTFDTEESDDHDGETQTKTLPKSPTHTESSEGSFVYLYRRRVHCYRYITLVACTLIVISTLLFGLNGFWNLQNQLSNVADSWTKLQSKNLMIQNDLQNLQELLFESQIDQKDNALHQSMEIIRSLLDGHCPKVSFGVCPQDRRKLTDSYRRVEDRFPFDGFPSEVDVVSAPGLIQEAGPSTSVNDALPSLDITGGSGGAFSSFPKDTPRSSDSSSRSSHFDFSTCDIKGIPLEDLWSDWITRVTTSVASILNNGAESWLMSTIDESDFFIDDANNLEVESGINAWDWALWGALASNICISILAFAIMWSVVRTSHDQNWVNTRSGISSTSESNSARVTTMPEPFWCCTPTLFSIGYWLLFVLAWVFGLCFSIGTILTVDSCYQDDSSTADNTKVPSSNTVFTEVLRQWEENQESIYPDSVSPISITDYWIYHINGCPDDQFPTSIRDEFLVGWNDVFESTGVLVRNLDALPQSIFQDICGISSAQSKELLVGALTSFQAQSCQISQSFSQLQSDLTCQQWQPTLQQDLIVETICQEGANGLVWVTSTQLMILLMGLLIWTFRITFMPVNSFPNTDAETEDDDDAGNRSTPCHSFQFCNPFSSSFRRRSSNNRISRTVLGKKDVDEEEGDHVGLILSSRRSYADESLNAALSGSYDNSEIINSSETARAPDSGRRGTE